MTKIEQLKQEANLYTDTSGRWANADGVDRLIELIVRECGHAVDDAPQPVVRFLPYLLEHFGVEE
jgi:hypothetical protein